MKIDSGFKLILAVIGLGIGFMLPEIWEFLTSLFS